jgi:hypothetical protein
MHPEVGEKEVPKLPSTKGKEQEHWLSKAA